MRMTKRFLALVLCVLMVVTAFPASVLAADAAAEESGENVTTALPVVKHSYWDFEDLAEGATSANGTDLFSDSNLGFTGKNETWNVGTEDDGNRYISVAASQTRYLYDTADFFYRNTFEMSFRIRFQGSGNSAATVSLMRLLYENNYDTSYNRVEFIDVLGAYKNSDGGYDFVTYLSENITTGSQTATGVTVDPEKWYDVSYRLDMETGEMALYIDGSLVATGTVGIVKKLIALEATDPTKVNKVDGFEIARSYSQGIADFDNIHIKPIASVVSRDDEVTEYVVLDGGEETAAVMGATVTQPSGITAYISPKWATLKNGQLYMIADPTSDAIQIKSISSAIGSQPMEVFFDYTSLSTAEYGAHLEFVYDSGSPTPNRRPLYVMSAGNTGISGEIGFGFGGRNAKNMLFHFPAGETHNIGVRFYPADQTYDFFLDGELVAYTTNVDNVYTLYRPYMDAEPISCSIAVTDTVTADDVNASLKSTFGFEDSNKRWPVVAGTHGTYVKALELDRYVYNADHILDNIVVRDCIAANMYPYALSCACAACGHKLGEATLATVKENITLTDGVYTNAAEGDTALLLDASDAYGEGKTVISGKVTVTADASSSDTLTLATLDLYATDGTHKGVVLGEIDAQGNVYFAGNKYVKLASDVAYKFQITVDADKSTAKLEMFSNEKYTKWLVNETVSLGEKLDLAVPTMNAEFAIDGEQYILAAPAVVTVLGLMKTSEVAFSVSDLVVENAAKEALKSHISYHSVVTFEEASAGTLTADYVDAQLADGFASTTTVSTSAYRKLSHWKVADEQKYVQTAGADTPDDTTDDVWEYQSAGNGNKVITQATPGYFPLFSIFDTKGILWDQPFEFSFDIYPKTAQVDSGGSGKAENTGFISLGWDEGINSATRVNLLGMNGNGSTYTRIYRGDGDFSSKIADLYNNVWYNVCIRVYPAEGRVVAFVDGDKLHESVLPNVKKAFDENDPTGAGISIGWNYGQSFDFDLDNVSLCSIAETPEVNEYIDFENAVLESVPASTSHESLKDYLNANSDSTTAAAYYNDDNASYYYLAEDKGNWVMEQNVPANMGKNAGFNFKDTTLLTGDDTLEITFDFKKVTASLAAATNTVRFSGGTTMSPLTFRNGNYISTGALGFAVFRKTADGFVQATLDQGKWYSFKVYTDLTGTMFKLWMKEGNSSVVADSLEWEPLYLITNGTADGQPLAEGVTSQAGCLLAQTAAGNTYPLADYEALMTTEGDMAWYNDGAASFGATPQVWFMYATNNAWSSNNNSYMDNLTLKTGDGDLDLSFDFTPDNLVVTPEAPANTDWWINSSFENTASKKAGGPTVSDCWQIVDAPAEASKYGKVIAPKETLGVFCFDDTDDILSSNVFEVSYDFYHTAQPSSNIHMLKLWAGTQEFSTMVYWGGQLMIADMTVAGSNRKSADVKTYLALNTWYNLRVRFNFVEGYYEVYVNDRLIHVQDIAEVYPDLDLNAMTDLHFEIHNHYNANVKGYHFIDNVRVNTVDSAQPNFEGIRLFGIQQHNSANAIRVIAGVTSLNYSNVGFTFELLDENGIGWRKVDDRITNTVYTSIVAGGETVSAAELGCVYFVMAIIEDVHSEGTLCIRPYTTNNYVRNYGEDAIYVAKINDGGLFLEPGEIALSDAGYKLYKHETFETARDTFQSYGSNYTETSTGEFKFGGQINTAKATVGTSTAYARSGEKAMIVDNLLPEGTGTTFSGRIKLNNLMPYDMTAYEGKVLKISAYVRVSDLQQAGNTVPMTLGIMGDKNTSYAASKSITVVADEWTLLEFEARITDTVLSAVGEGYPTRVFIGLGHSNSNYPATVYVDDIKVSFKDSVGLTLPSIFADNMIVQRNATTAVWGWDGMAGDKITATLGTQSASGTVDENGEFYLEIPAQAGASGQTLTVTNETGGTNVSYKNVGIGEVLYCSGQSNMQLSVKAVHNNAELIAEADSLDVRSFKMSGSNSVYTPQRDVKNGSWTKITSSNVTGRSAIAYVTASQLQAELGVPVAIIEAFNGGSAANAWLGYDKVFAADRAEIYNDRAGLPTWAEFPNEDTQRHEDGLLRNGSGVEGRTMWEDYDYYWQVGTANEGTRASCLYGGYSDRFAPTGLYNGVQYPLKNYAVGAVLWYQGEARLNSMQPEQYNYILKDLVDQWREDFRNDELPVVIFQLAPYSAYYNEIRQSQLDTAKRDDHVYAITTATEGAIYSQASGGSCLDLDRSTKSDGTQSGGNAIHPGSKIPVATRAANTLLANEYGVASYASLLNPEYQSMTVNGNVVTLTFSDANGLKIHSGDAALEGFRALDASGNELTVVSAVIDGDTVVVTTEAGTTPSVVTYGWWVSSTRREVNYPNIELNGTEYPTQYINVMEGNLENAAGQPAIPFYASVSDISIYDVSAEDGKLTVEIRELGHLCSTYRVVVDINGTATEYTADFTTAGNFVVDGLTVKSGDSVTVTLKTADGASLIEVKSVSVQ